MIKRQGKSYLLRAESDEDCQSWIEGIQKCIVEVNELECQSSEDEDYVVPISPTADNTSDKACKLKNAELTDYQFGLFVTNDYCIYDVHVCVGICS